MLEEFRLDKTELPHLPCPHDCVVNKVEFDDSHLIFVFEKHISLHDSIQYLRPQSDSLIIRYHLLYPDFSTYRSIRHVTRLGKRFGRSGFHLVDNRELKKPEELEYLWQKIDYKSILIGLSRRDGRSILIDAAADYVEYEWIDK